jgi:hypothetical protein
MECYFYPLLGLDSFGNWSILLRCGDSLAHVRSAWLRRQMPVLLAQDLTATESIKFSIGMPRDVIRISTADFKKLEEPIVTSFAATKCCRPTAAKAAA